MFVFIVCVFLAAAVVWVVSRRREPAEKGSIVVTATFRRWPERVARHLDPTAIETFEEVGRGWWPPSAVSWGRAHPPTSPPYDWAADRPRAVVGRGRGRVL